MTTNATLTNALFHAILHLDTDKVTAMLNQGADVHARNAAGKTTLEVALSPMDSDDLGIHTAGEAFIRQHVIEKLLIEAGASVMGQPAYDPPLLARVLSEGFFAIQIEESDADNELVRLQSWVKDGDAKNCPDAWGPQTVEAWVEGMTDRHGADEEDDGIQFGHQVVDFLIEHGVALSCFDVVDESCPGYAALRAKLLPFEREAKVDPLDIDSDDAPQRSRARARP